MESEQARENIVAHILVEKERTTDVKLKEMAIFEKMLLSNYVKKGLQQAGFICPTVIQATAIPVGKSGLDLLVQSKSGTGKTLIFSTIILEAYESKVQDPQSLVIAPTREIAVQIEIVLNQIGRHCAGFRAVAVIGGMEVSEDRKRLARARAVVGTPGRLLHLLENGVFNTRKIKLLVLDEADKLYSSSFRKDVQRILKSLPAQRQIISCSATFNNDLDKQLAKIMRNPLLISTETRATLLVGIKQFVCELPEKKASILEMQAKLDALRSIFSRIPFQQCLIFAGSQSRADSYRNYLEKDGWPCDLISGAQDQQTRLEIFRKFREFKTRILLATDLMARGVDSEHVNLVINLELPNDVVTYLHRIGRAGRFGSHGIAISFVASAKDDKNFKGLISEIGAGMNVLKFPAKGDNDDKYDIWNFNNFEEEVKKFGLFNAEPLAPLASLEQLSLTESADKEETDMTNASALQSSSIDTKTFQENSKDSALNGCDLHIDELEVKQSPVEQPQRPTSPHLTQVLNTASHHSSMQLLPSSNTIDDASSIAADSLQSSSQQDISCNQATLFVRKATVMNLFECLVDATSSESVAKCANATKSKPNEGTFDLFDHYTEEVLNNSNNNNSTCETPKKADDVNEPQQSKLKMTDLKSLLIDKPTMPKEIEIEKHDHLYSDYTNFDECDDAISTATNTNSNVTESTTQTTETATTTEDIDKAATFVLSITTPSHAQDSLEELHNSSLNGSQLGSASDTQSVPPQERPHFTSPAPEKTAPPPAALQAQPPPPLPPLELNAASPTSSMENNNPLSPTTKRSQQNLTVNIVEGLNIQPVERDHSPDSDTLSVVSTPRDSDDAASVAESDAYSVSGSHTEPELERSSGFNEDTNFSESSGIEPTDLDNTSNETEMSDIFNHRSVSSRFYNRNNLFDRERGNNAGGDDIDDEMKYKLNFMLNGYYDSDDPSDYSHDEDDDDTYGSDGDSDDVGEDAASTDSGENSGRHVHRSRHANLSRDSSEIHDPGYQTAYDRWVHLYKNQLAYVQNYVIVASHTQQQPE